MEPSQYRDIEILTEFRDIDKILTKRKIEDWSSPKLL